jgi:hypothetical protein
MIKDHGGLSEQEMFEAMEARRNELCKVNLRYEDGENGEGIWALPCAKEDETLAWGDSKGGVFYVYLCNEPICVDVVFGSKVACLTNGTNRPYSQELSSPEGKAAYQIVLAGLAAVAATAG